MGEFEYLLGNILVMYKLYYLNPNAQSTGEHEVHAEGCLHLSLIPHPIPLGAFSNCFDAVKKAKEIRLNVDGCYYCCYACHKR